MKDVRSFHSVQNLEGDILDTLDLDFSRFFIDPFFLGGDKLPLVPFKIRFSI